MKYLRNTLLRLGIVIVGFLWLILINVFAGLGILSLGLTPIYFILGLYNKNEDWSPINDLFVSYTMTTLDIINWANKVINGEL